MRAGFVNTRSRGGAEHFGLWAAAGSVGRRKGNPCGRAGEFGVFFYGRNGRVDAFERQRSGRAADLWAGLKWVSQAPVPLDRFFLSRDEAVMWRTCLAMNTYWSCLDPRARAI